MPDTNMHAPTELLLRQRRRFENRRTLVMECPDPSSIGMLADGIAGVEWSFLLRDFAVHRVAAARYTSVGTVAFGLQPTSTIGAPESVVIYMPREKEVLDMTLQLLAGRLVEPVPVAVVGPNRGGVKSAQSILARHGGPTMKVDAARHCSLVEGSLKPAANRTASPADFEARWKHDDDSGALTIVSIPGVFSHGHLDDGTACLLEAVELPAGGSFLDVGSGSGVVGAVVAAGRPQMAVTMIDAQATALYASRRTAEANDLTNVEVVPSDFFSDIAGSFDVIACNPPFHRGGETSFGAIDRLIAGSTSRLAPGGSLWLVANSFLPYRERLAEAFTEVIVVHDDRRYRVYRCRGARGERKAGATD